MTDSRYFSTTRKGEIHELKQELNTPNREKKKEAVKKVIAAMTVGKDVSSLFTDVVNCMQTDNLELKKLVYLYLINYAKTHPDLAILAVNTFVKDSQDPNPLIRALAVRTMGCIRVDKITEYLCDPLQRTLKDEDPYVRKTAAICVAKLYDINPELVEDRGFLDFLRDLLSDSNPMVVANAVAALAEIQDISISSREVFRVTAATVFKLLAALNECTEWGQVFILDALAGYTPKDPRDAESIVERVTPRLQHANSAVVLSAVKVIIRMMDHIRNDEIIRQLCKKMAPPLVTLLSAEPEIQYVALRNIHLIVQKRPSILSHEIKVFFCKYNDPIYVKVEKLEIMIMLASERNIDQVLLELKEYATEVDVDIVRKSVRAIGRCAIKLDRAAERCIAVLLELIQTKVNYVVQEAIVVIKDIFRRYPNMYESIIATLCENLDTLDEPEAKASMIWIIGEYAERIDNADELLEQFLETFPEESAQVQLQLLTATVKLFLKKPTEGPQQMIQAVLNNATQETDNPDLRDRAYIYWRLLSTDPEAAKDIVLAEKPVINADTSNMDPALVESLLQYLATLASVYHKPPEAFVSRARTAVLRADDVRTAAVDEGIDETSGPVPEYSAQPAAGNFDLLGGDGPSAVPSKPAPAPPQDLLGDLLGLDGPPVPAAPAAVPQTSAGGLGGFDDFGLGLGAPAAPPQSQYPIMLPAAKAQGLEVSGKLSKKGGSVAYNLRFANGSSSALDGFMIQFNKNTFGIAPSAPLQVPPLAPGQTAEVVLPIAFDESKATPPPASPLLQIAVKNNQQPVWYFQDNINLGALFRDDGPLERSIFLEAWKSLPDSNERTREVRTGAANVDAVQAKLQAGNVFVVARRQLRETNQDVVYASVTLARNIPLLVEIKVTPGSPVVAAAMKSNAPDLADAFFSSLDSILA